jgi:hypothetical protein
VNETGVVCSRRVRVVFSSSSVGPFVSPVVFHRSVLFSLLLLGSSSSRDLVSRMMGEPTPGAAAGSGCGGSISYSGSATAGVERVYRRMSVNSVHSQAEIDELERSECQLAAGSIGSEQELDPFNPVKQPAAPPTPGMLQTILENQKQMLSMLADISRHVGMPVPFTFKAIRDATGTIAHVGVAGVDAAPEHVLAHADAPGSGPLFLGLPLATNQLISLDGSVYEENISVAASGNGNGSSLKRHGDAGGNDDNGWMNVRNKRPDRRTQNRSQVLTSSVSRSQEKPSVKQKNNVAMRTAAQQAQMKQKKDVPQRQDITKAAPDAHRREGVKAAPDANRRGGIAKARPDADRVADQSARKDVAEQRRSTMCQDALSFVGKRCSKLVIGDSHFRRINGADISRSVYVVRVSGLCFNALCTALEGAEVRPGVKEVLCALGTNDLFHHPEGEHAETVYRALRLLKDVYPNAEIGFLEPFSSPQLRYRKCALQELQHTLRNIKGALHFFNIDTAGCRFDDGGTHLTGDDGGALVAHVKEIFGVEAVRPAARKKPDLEALLVALLAGQRSQ